MVRPRISSPFLSMPPIRVLEPAATITASAKGRCSATRLSEDHPAGDGLQDANHGDFDLVIDHLASAFDDDHGSVVEIGETLTRLLALLDDLDLKRVSGQERRLEGVGQLVQVEDADVVKLRDAVEVVVVGQDAGATSARELDQLGVHRLDRRGILVAQLNGYPMILLENIEHLQTTSAANASRLVAVVGDVLQLGNDKARNHQSAEQEAAGDYVGH